MRFAEIVNWHDGLFLQQQHLQRLEYAHASERRAERVFALPCPEGFIDLDIDREALNAKRVVIRSFSCIMPDGTELSSPGNAKVASLTLSPEDEERDHLMVYLSVPQWSHDEANLSKGEQDKNRLWSVEERAVRDENTGDDEISITMKRANVRIVTEKNLGSDQQYLPVMRLIRVAKNTEGARLIIDDSYMPPFALISESSPLLSKISEFLFELRSCRDFIQTKMETHGFDSEELSGRNLLWSLQLRSINRFEASVSPMLHPYRLTPLQLYREMRILLGELAALRPLERLEDVSPYVHADCLPVIEEMQKRIRTLIIAEGGAGYREIEFKPDANGHMLATLNEDDFVGAEGWYLAVRSSRCDDDVAGDVESGDNFRLITPEALTERVRGFKTVEVKYPPHYLPVVSGAMWFRIETNRSPRMWREIPEGKSLMIDYSESVFPALKASLYITIIKKNK